MALSKQNNPLSAILSPIVFSFPESGDPSLRWLILDGRSIALRYGCGETYNYRGIDLAVQSLRYKGHEKYIVYLPMWMKTHLDSHDLTGLQGQLLYMPSDVEEASYMDALSRKMDALIITQLGPDIWIEHRTRIVEFDFDGDDFFLPAYQWGKKGPKLSRLFRLRKPKDISIQKLATVLMLKWRRFSERLKKPFDLSLSEEPGNDLGVVIIDGSNVAMRHGFGTFYSCRGIYLAVLSFWTEGYRKIIVCVPYWRYNSRNTVYGHKYLDLLYKKGLVTLTPSEDDRFMLEIALENNGMIVTNDKFRDFGEEWKDVINKCIPFEFEQNHFRVIASSRTPPASLRIPSGCPSSTPCLRPIDLGEGSAYVPNTGQTLHPDPPRPEDED